VFVALGQAVCRKVGAHERAGWRTVSCKRTKLPYACRSGSGWTIAAKECDTFGVRRTGHDAHRAPPEQEEGPAG
jgi:hypothetical protein